MHGRDREEYKAYQRDTKISTALAKKATAWYQINDELIKRKNQLSGITSSLLSSSGSSSSTTSRSTTTTTNDLDPTTTNTNNTNDNEQQHLQQQTLQLNEKAITVNPDPLWLWNQRREILLRIEQQHHQQHNNNNNNKQQDQDSVEPNDPSHKEQRGREGGGESSPSLFVTQLFTNELNLIAIALQNNPKAYGPWHHRKWCIRYYYSIMTLQQQQRQNSTNTDTTTSTNNNSSIHQVLTNELELTQYFLTKDERNFHCWSYRRYVVSCLLVHTTTTTSKSIDESSTNDNSNIMIDGSWITTTIPTNTDDELGTNKAANVVWMGAQIVPSISSTTRTTTTTSISKLEETDNTTSTSTTQTPTATVISVSSFDVVTILQKEWDYTTSKIHSNFSNCSAFHYRSKLFPLHISVLLGQSTTITDNTTTTDDTDTTKFDLLSNLFQNELELISNAIFTEPDDQTIWWYQRFLFDYMAQYQQQQNYSKSSSDTDSETTVAQINISIPTTIIDWFYTELVPSHIEQLRELQQEIMINTNNGSGKWVMIGLYQTIEYYTKYLKQQQPGGCDTDDTIHSMDTERRTIIQQLLQIDPDRCNRYQSLLRKI